MHESRRTRIGSRRRVTVVVAGLAVMLAAAGCGSSSDEPADTASDSSTGSTQGAQSTQGTDDVVSADVAARLDALEKRPTQIAITEPIGKPVPAGKSVAVAICGLPSCKDMGEAIEQAAEALQWKYIEIAADTTPQATKTSWEQMLREKPDAIINLSQPKAFFAPELKKAEEQGIPVVDVLVADTEAGGGISYVAYGPKELNTVGVDMANWITRDSGGEANALVVNIPQIPLLDAIAKGFDEEFKQVCDGCGLERLDVPVTSIGNDLATRIVGFLRGHPDVTYVMAGYQDMVQGLPAALRAAGRDDVKVIANGGLQPDVAAYLREGKPVVAFYAYAGTQATWRSIDWLARHFAGVSTKPTEEAPAEAWLALPDTTPEGGAPNLVEDFQAQYKKLWGVG